ncbi:MAG: DUF2497 domain-containing protein [Nitratireductor sp.]|nr:DUF2497 domain-containing protein [Nitratireductor sp.]MCC0019776.1 DUF2497 domain-containing protein [Nitratireductor sp.]
MAEAAVKDTSMEDILASIRKIINSDSKLEDKPAAQPASAEAPPAAAPATTAPGGSGSAIAASGETGNADNAAKAAVPGSPQAAREAAAVVAAVRREMQPDTPPAHQPASPSAAQVAPETEPASASAVETAHGVSPASQAGASSDLALEPEAGVSISAAEKHSPAPPTPAASATQRPSLAELARELRLKGSAPAHTPNSQPPAAAVSVPQEDAAEATHSIGGTSGEPAPEAELEQSELLGETFLDEIGAEEAGLDETSPEETSLDEAAFDEAGLDEAFEAEQRRAAEFGREPGEPILVEVEPDEVEALRSEPESSLQAVSEAPSQEFEHATAPVQAVETEAEVSGGHADPAASLVSPVTEAAVNSSIERLKQSIAGNEAARVEAVLRPMLKEWLDSNLPGLVEKIVREEIARLIK